MTGNIIKVSPDIGRSWKDRGIWAFTEKWLFYSSINQLF